MHRTGVAGKGQGWEVESDTGQGRKMGLWDCLGHAETRAVWWGERLGWGV